MAEKSCLFKIKPYLCAQIPKKMTTREFIYHLVEPSEKSERKVFRFYDWLMLASIILGIFPLTFKGHHTLFIVFDLISGGLFIIDYLLRWLTADLHLKRGWTSFIRYPFTPMAIIDLLSILPTLSLMSPTFKLVRLSRLLKLLRVIKVVRYFESLEIILAVIRKQSRTLCTVFSLALFYTFITALIMFNAEQELVPGTGQPLFRNFFDAFYWALCTLTTVGYGDIYPISDIGRIISIISSMVGIAIVALPSGIITAGYMEELKLRKEEQEQAQAQLQAPSEV